jgi:drug/metabolite transporter (DMT)-like permease
MGRNENIQAIVEIGRRTRTPTPRWLWIAAAVVGVICSTGFLAIVLPIALWGRDPPRHPVEQRPPASSGFGMGLAIGASAGVAIGFSIGRQRRSHSSRRSP